MSQGKNIKFGDDKRQVSIVPNNQQNLYNIANGELLIDEYGNPIITEVDTYYAPDASTKRSTSIVFNTKDSKYSKNVYTQIGIATATYGSLNNIVDFSVSGIVTTLGIAVNDIISGPGIPDNTLVSRIPTNSRILLSNNSSISAIQTGQIRIQRISPRAAKSVATWKIAEQFKESSEVSVSLLGISRAEVQLGLFANVSSYGLDPDEFEFYSSNTGNSFGSWENRGNEIYGNRYNATRTEETQESAIKITAFPVPFSYPFGPKFEKLGLYNETYFNQYKNFIKLGNDLHDYFNGPKGAAYPSSWKNKFLSSSIANIQGNDVVYVAGIDTAFRKIDTWTETWRDISEKILIDPVTGNKFTFGIITILVNYYTDESITRPGYSSSEQRFAYLQSRRVFRYQPGRISGFTFGLRSSVEAVTGITLEWGIVNPTDQYIFRIDAGKFSIIRRSTVPLEKSVLERNGLTLSDQKNIPSGDPFDSRQYYTIDIPKDKFNGDPLTGNGKSGYLLKPENVTMYKIEFGWYGAIGARFYAYIPTSNGDARWVVIHTLVIENSLGAPCLQDSYFRFKYSVNISDTVRIRTPQYLYKYGASYYIDGGDEGTSQIYSVSSKQKTLSSSKVKSLIGVYPKEYLYNRDGVPIENKKIIIPSELNVSTNSLTEVKVVTCTACPGFGHVYTPGIAKTESGRYIDIVFTDKNTIQTVGLSSFFESDVGAKIIAPSIYNAYISSVDTLTQKAKIKGFGGLYGFELVDRDIAGPDNFILDRVSGVTTSIPINVTYPYPVRLSNYDCYAATDYAFTGSKIEIQFVNPNKGDSYAHFADFLIGITDKKPDVTLPSTLNGFITPGVGTTTILPNTDILYGEHIHSFTAANEDGVEVAEGWALSQPPVRMGIDYRIPALANPAGGICSKVTVTVQEPLQINNVNEYDVNPETGSNDGNRYVQIQGEFLKVDYDGGQVTILQNGNAIRKNSKFVGVTSSYDVQVGENKVKFSYIRITNTLNAGSNFTMLIRPVNIQANGGVNLSKLYNYDPWPLYLVAKLKDNAQINNISVKETTGDSQKTITPQWYISGSAISIDNAEGKVDVIGDPQAPTNFKEISRLSSALIDTQNDQPLRPYIERDTLYIGANSTDTIDLDKVFGPNKRVITPDNNNIDATFITAKKIDGPGSGVIEASLNFKEQ